MEKYKQDLIKELMLKYIDLDIELDSCQGCTDNLQSKFNELNFYKSQIENLGGNFEKLKKEMYSKRYNELIKQQKEEERIVKEKDKIIKYLTLNLLSKDNLSILDNEMLPIIFDIQGKINEICDILRNNLYKG